MTFSFTWDRNSGLPIEGPVLVYPTQQPSPLPDFVALKQFFFLLISSFAPVIIITATRAYG